jgi:hypothetical protein
MKRRTFLFKSPITYLFALTGFATSSFANSSSSASNDAKTQNWKVTTTINYPKEMTKEEFIRESKKWTQQKEGDRIFKEFEREGKVVSVRVEWKRDCKVRTVVFRTYQDGIELENACSKARITDRETRSKLGYYITVDSTYV